jgi:mono/diheme cytochrome c family protein
VAIVFGLATAGCRQDMHNQPRYKPLAATTFFGDGRSARPVIEDTVARGHMRLDEARYTGKVNGADVNAFPFTITRADMRRGQERFNIYCSPCHGRAGDGRGMIVRRGFRQPPSYYSERIMKAPLGHYFDVVTNGFGAMPSYASRVPVDDRWRILAYIRALQYSENASLNDVPTDRREDLDKPPQPQEGADIRELQRTDVQPSAVRPERKGAVQGEQR